MVLGMTDYSVIINTIEQSVKIFVAANSREFFEMFVCVRKGLLNRMAHLTGAGTG
jgi:hypothetical protein